MVTTIELAPSAALSAFIRCYIYREYNTLGHSVERPWFAAHEFFIAFFLKDKPVQLVVQQTGQVITGSHISPMGVTTGFNGIMTYRGEYKLFSINFKPNGFKKLFNIPQDRFTDAIYGDEVFDSSIRLLFEELQEAGSLNRMMERANAFLLAQLSKRKSIVSNDAITAVSNLILSSHGMVNIRKLSSVANMAPRTFERNFKEQVGTSPKLFSRIIRFNQALSLKLKHPKIHWTSIAYQMGYFDQMHLIKDFKQFTGSVPSTFIAETAFLENDISLETALRDPSLFILLKPR